MRVFLIIVVAFFSLNAYADPRADYEAALDDWQTVLETYVDEQGLVDYDKLQVDRRPLDAYNASIQLTSQATYDSWSEPEQIAFLINALSGN